MLFQKNRIIVKVDWMEHSIQKENGEVIPNILPSLLLNISCSGPSVSSLRFVSVSLSVLLDFLFFSPLTHTGFSLVFSGQCLRLGFHTCSPCCAFSSPLDAVPAGVAVRCRNETTLQKLRTADRLLFAMGCTTLMHPIV